MTRLTFGYDRANKNPVAVNLDSDGNLKTRPADDLVSNTLSVGQNVLSTSAELVVASNPGRVFGELTNDDASIKVYLGSTSGVTSTTGHVLKPGASFSFDGYTGPGLAW
jgi:hypothetical protein